MRILVLAGDLVDRHGWGKYSLDVINALTEEGVDVSVVMAKKGSNETQIKALRLLPAWGDNMANYFGAFIYALKLRSYAKDYDLIHVFVEPYACIAYWLSIFSGKKYVVTTHGSYGLVPFRTKVIKYLHRIAFAHAQKIICVSSYTRKRLIELGFQNLVVINNGIDIKKYNVTQVPTFHERQNALLSVGALKYRKGQHIAIEAFSRIAQSAKEAHYYVVGDQDDEPYYKRLKHAVENFGIKDRVTFLTHISDDELLALYRRVKVFMLPSISKGPYFEGFGLVFLEANACGLPVIGSLDCGAEDAIKGRETGFLTEQNDVESIAKIAKQLLEDSSLWGKMSQRGIVWAQEHDWKKVIKRYSELYKTT